MVLESFPVPAGAGLVAPAPNHLKPDSTHRLAELFQPCVVPGDGVIIEPSLNDASKPSTLYVDRFMHLFPECLLYCFQSHSHAFGYRDPDDLKRPSAGGPAAVRETEEVKCLRSPLPPSLTAGGCESSKFDQSRLFRVER